MNELEIRLSEGLTALNLSHSPTQRKCLIDFLKLLHKWNRAYNLTAIQDIKTAVDLHLLDSLTVLPYLKGNCSLDIGTGAGFPGIPLAIMDKEHSFTLLDSQAKKTRFIQQAVIELGIRNVQIVTQRVENYFPECLFDSVLTRAYATLGEIFSVSGRFLAPGGKILALKGRFPEDELRALRRDSVHVHRLILPGVEVERHLIEYIKTERADLKNHN